MERGFAFGAGRESGGLSVRCDPREPTYFSRWLFSAHCYYKAHKRHTPEVARSPEQVISDNEDKKARRRERRAQRSEEHTSELQSPC